MTDKDAKTGPGSPEGADPLSATGMFLRAFESKPENEERPGEATRALRPAPTVNDARPSHPAPAPAGSGAPGEFTQFFESLNPRPTTPARPSSEAETAVSAGPTAVLRGPGQPPAPEPGAGEFTKIFVSNPAPPAPAVRAADEPRKSPPPPPVANPAPPASKAKGFSSPGLSDSASGEGSFTQFFKAPQAPPTRPAQAPPQSFTPASPPAPKSDWSSEPAFRPAEKPAASPDSPMSVTGLINSLAAQNSGQTSRTPEPAPYRPEPLPFAPSAARPSEPQGMEQGGVTRLIQRLAQEQGSAPATPPSPQPPAEPVHSGPGEFTRMISGLNAPPSPIAPPPTAPPPAAPAAFAPPPMPKMAPPPLPPMPKVPPPPAAPAFTPHAAPPAPAPAFSPPALPKPAPSPVAVAPPKGKLESMVPILLVINTFLLLVILLVMIFLIKAK